MKEYEFYDVRNIIKISFIVEKNCTAGSKQNKAVLTNVIIHFQCDDCRERAQLSRSSTDNNLLIKISFKDR
jgi:hypothetical protein